MNNPVGSSLNPFGEEEPPNPFDEPGDIDDKNPFNEDDTGSVSSNNPFNESSSSTAARTADEQINVGASARVGQFGGRVGGVRKYPAPQPPVPVPENLVKERSGAIVRSLIPLEETTQQHHELFLQEIEAVDEYWGPTFRYPLTSRKYHCSIGCPKSSLFRCALG